MKQKLTSKVDLIKQRIGTS